MFLLLHPPTVRIQYSKYLPAKPVYITFLPTYSRCTENKKKCVKREVRTGEAGYINTGGAGTPAKPAQGTKSFIYQQSRPSQGITYSRTTCFIEEATSVEINTAADSAKIRIHRNIKDPRRRHCRLRWQVRKKVGKENHSIFRTVALKPEAFNQRGWSWLGKERKGCRKARAPAASRTYTARDFRRHTAEMPREVIR